MLFFSRLRFQTKIVLGISLIMVLMAVSIAVPVSRIATRATITESRERGKVLAENLALQLVDSMLTLDFLRIKTMIDELRGTGDDIDYAFVLDAAGNVLAHTFEKGFPVELLAANSPEGPGAHIHQLDTGSGLIYDFAVPVVIADKRLGTVRLGLSLSRVRAEIRRLNLTLAGLFSAVLVVALALSSMFARRVTRRINLLKQYALEVVADNPSSKGASILAKSCWEIMHCGLSQCPAYGQPRLRCWQMPGTLCPNCAPVDSLGQKSCASCPVYLVNAGDEIQDLAEAFDYMTESLERREKQHEQDEEQLLYRALHDSLTGLANRALCLDRIAQANERAARKPESTFSVVFIDVDRFKVINDSLGHEAGDQVLREVAKRLLTCARRVDTVCRYGGDEFILVLEDVNPRETLRTVNRVRASLRNPMTIDTQWIHVEASYGIVYAPQQNCLPEDLLRNASIALHRAKLSGRDRIVAYRKGMHEAAIQTLGLQSDMRRGLDVNEFYMVYQPIFSLENNRLAGFEALIRWNHPLRGIVGPSEFIPMAEDTGFIYELGYFALNQACTDMVGLLLDLPAEDRLTISVNLSPRQLSRQGLADQIEQTLIATGLPPSALVLEITESSLMKYPEASAHILAKLKEKGVGIAIDDFGTGYSSMSALQKLPLDRLKVDMSFVSRINGSSQDREIVQAIITLAHSLNFKTVAEGIETEEQREALRDMRCDLGQGYLCARPMLLADVPQIIRQMVCAQGLPRAGPGVI